MRSEDNAMKKDLIEDKKVYRQQNRMSIKKANSRIQLYTEDFFLHLLLHERKRTERSKNPFSLLLIDISHFTYSKRYYKLLHALCKIIFTITRDIDLKGWYSSNRIIGILLTNTDADTRDIVVKKIQSVMDREIDTNYLHNIVIKDYSFPGTDTSDKDSDEWNSIIYSSDRFHGTVSPLMEWTKRFIDIFGSIVAMILFSPLLIIIPFLIKLTSNGPVFFSQSRLGKYGKPFSLLKYRSMYSDSDSSIHKDYVTKFIHGNNDAQYGAKDGLFKMVDDPRVTSIGKILRKLSLDELPQLFNVLKGDMSLVGPRPALLYEVEQYDLWHHPRVFEVKPGITGLWQVTGRSTTTFDDMVRLDIQYIRNWTLTLDVKLILLTPFVMFTSKGAG